MQYAKALDISLASPRQPESIKLIAELDAYLGTLYPAEANHLMDIASLEQSNVRFYLAHVGREAVGCIALVTLDGYGEIKRMYVAPAWRKRRIAQALLDRAIRDVERLGIGSLKLETGAKQTAALQFYERAGFKVCAAFGDYFSSTLSICMERALPAMAL